MVVYFEVLLYNIKRKPEIYLIEIMLLFIYLSLPLSPPIETIMPTSMRAQRGMVISYLR